MNDLAIEAAARIIDPRAFSGAMLVLGCGSAWHYTAHSCHSICWCGSPRWNHRWALEEKQAEAQERSRAVAEKALAAALAVEAMT
jgi:hypothetical protein